MRIAEFIQVERELFIVKIENLTNPNKAPKEGDKVRIINGKNVTIKQFHDEPLVINYKTFNRISFLQLLSVDSFVDLAISANKKDKALFEYIKMFDVFNYGEPLFKEIIDGSKLSAAVKAVISGAL